jgi:hypothetical protein
MRRNQLLVPILARIIALLTAERYPCSNWERKAQKDPLPESESRKEKNEIYRYMNIYRQGETERYKERTVDAKERYLSAF